MSFPVDDWQFWVVTVVAAAAFFGLLWKTPIPWRRKHRKGRRVSLTVRGRPPSD